MAWAALELVVGWILLWKGGDALVSGADRFARGRGMPSSLAGVVILGFGTSAPELATSVVAAFQGATGIAAGNVVGSNVANVALILGVAALLAPLLVDRFLLRVEMPIAIGASLLVFVLFQDGAVGRGDGLLLLACFVAYMVVAVLTAGRRPAPPESEVPHRPALELGLAALGLGGVVLGAWAFVDGAVTVAREFGVSETVIGLSLVAVGTSLPELATTVAAARRGQIEMAIGNIAGSNIFNLLLVLGVAGVVRTQDAEPRLVRFDVPVMLGLMVLPWLMGMRRRGIGRWEGLFLLLLYAGYAVSLALLT